MNTFITRSTDRQCLISRLKPAFTLAEVLITLAIVGVIASLTIPSLITSIGNAQTIAKLKKTYATWSQVFQLVQNENGGIESVFSSTTEDADALNIFAAKLNVIKNCGAAMGCWYATRLSHYDGSLNTSNLDNSWTSNYGKAMLADGSMIRIDNYKSTCNSSAGTGALLNSVCGNIYLDVNGSDGPNTVGKDYHYFWLTKTGFQPMGSNADGRSCGSGFDYLTSAGCTATVLAGQ